MINKLIHKKRDNTKLKKATKIVVSVLAASGIFTAGILASDTKAGTDWKTDALNSANSVLGQAGYQKKNELIDKANTDINNVVQDKLSGDVEAQKEDLNKLLDDYYQAKISGIANGQELKDLETQIENIKNSIYQRYTQEIDQVINSQLSNN